MTATTAGTAGLFFSDAFGVSPETLTEHCAFDISVVTDLPLFVDPFLLFNSTNPDYQALHEQIIEYLRFLKDKAVEDVDPGLVKALNAFPEVRQNWLGFTEFGNAGSGLGRKFANALTAAFRGHLSNFGHETLSRSSHVEKLMLLSDGVGRDAVSDLTVNLIKHYLCRYTETFARAHLKPEQCREVTVARAAFDYTTQVWAPRRYLLPWLDGDFVLLTPEDMLTRDETWISRADLLTRLESLPAAAGDEQLRASVNNYLGQLVGRDPSPKQVREARARVLARFPELADLYIKDREDHGEEAVSVSQQRTEDTRRVLNQQVRDVREDLAARTDLLSQPAPRTYTEALARVHAFKQYVENQDGYLIVNRPGMNPRRETDVRLCFGLILKGSDSDVNHEVNNGRGPVDVKLSRGAHDKTLIEFKLASNSGLKRNLQNQVEIYAKANETRHIVKVIVVYTAQEQDRVTRVLTELKLQHEESVVVIDARNDNKPSASKA